MKAVIVEKIDGKPGQVYYPLKTIDLPKPSAKAGEVLVKIQAAALNHRDLFIRQSLYPAVSFETPLLADGTGVVVECGSSDLEQKWLGKRVLITPGRGWYENEAGPAPDEKYSIVGGTSTLPLGTLQEFAAIPASELELAPTHLSIPEAAGLPLGGLTAWRATMSKAKVSKGHNVLVTGIGGGVALFALQFAVAAGANVYVTSGSQDKIDKAKKLGAVGGVIYKEKDWAKQLRSSLPKSRPYLDSVVDGAGGDVIIATTPLLKNGGIISTYGMTVGPKIVFPMNTVLKNIDVRGSTMGSRKEFTAMVKFVDETKLKPVISMVVDGMDKADECFTAMKDASQFGKLVVMISNDQAKL